MIPGEARPDKPDTGTDRLTCTVPCRTRIKLNKKACTVLPQDDFFGSGHAESLNNFFVRLVFKLCSMEAKRAASDPTALVQEVALHTLQIESETLAGLQASILHEDFATVVQLIYHTPGRVVVTGIGKSAIIAQKIVATFNSTGTPALFMHAADAIHGDLGMVLPDDVVIAISKSGETPEIKALAPLVKKLGKALVGMVGQPESFLAKQSDYCLFTPVTREADPNNLAPTASTTAQIVMGDCLATALLALRGFSSAHFAQFHPGGALGKQLYLRVSDLYPLHLKPSVSPAATLPAIIVEMTSKRLGAAVVVNENEQVLGIITDGDLRRLLQKTLQLEGILAQDIMSPSPTTILPDEMAVQAMSMLREKSITQLVVADEQGVYLGLVHLHDLLREGIV